MFKPVSNHPDFAKNEASVLALWAEEKTFAKSLERRRGAPVFRFYDGPPFATGLPHYGHLLAGTIKDIVPRYQTMRGALKQAGECPVQQFAKRLLSGAYGFLCQYDRSTGRDTVWSVVYDLTARQIWRSEANPARCGYRLDDRLFF